MAVLEKIAQTGNEATKSGLIRHLFSREDYFSIAATGILDDQRVELIEGEIVDMTPIGDAHVAVTYPLEVLLGAAFGDGLWIRNQGPISIGVVERPSVPQPDVAVVVGSWRDYVSRKPIAKEISLVVEVSDSSLKYDRTTKAVLYAAAGIPEYWIVNLVNKQLEVHREPVDSKYSTITILKPGDHITPVLAPQATIPVSDFMP